MSAGSVTVWLQQLRERDADAPRRIWDRYYAQVVRLARSRLRGVPTAAGDEEDVAAAAFHSFFQAAGGGPAFDRLDDRGDLWQVLVVLTCRKAVDHRRAAGAARRPPAGAAEADCEAVFAGLAGKEPDPQFALAVAEEVALLFDRLPDDDLALRRIAAMKFEGYSTEEIGAACACSLRTVERRVWLIRRIWDDRAATPTRSPAGTTT